MLRLSVSLFVCELHVVFFNDHNSLPSLTVFFVLVVCDKVWHFRKLNVFISKAWTCVTSFEDFNVFYVYALRCVFISFTDINEEQTALLVRQADESM